MKQHAKIEHALPVVTLPIDRRDSYDRWLRDAVSLLEGHDYRAIHVPTFEELTPHAVEVGYSRAIDRAGLLEAYGIFRRADLVFVYRRKR